MASGRRGPDCPCAAACSPLFLAIALIARVTLGTPVIFRQRRPGRSAALLPCRPFRNRAVRAESSYRMPTGSEEARTILAEYESRRVAGTDQCSPRGEREPRWAPARSLNI